MTTLWIRKMRDFHSTHTHTHTTCVCVCVCVCIYVCACVCVCIYIYIYIFLCMYVCIYIYIYIYIYISSYLYTYRHACMHTSTHKFIHKYILDVQILSNAVLSLENYSLFFFRHCHEESRGCGEQYLKKCVGITKKLPHTRMLWPLSKFRSVAQHSRSLSESLSLSDRERKVR